MIKLIIPYELLCPDNQKMGLMRGRLILTSKYRQAKLKTSLLATCLYRGPLLETELELTATLYPPTRRKTDPSNFSKLLHDALEGVVYVNDYQIVKSTYIRGAVSRIDARMEIEITELPQSVAA